MDRQDLLGAQLPKRYVSLTALIDFTREPNKGLPNRRERRLRPDLL
jgi:hypothetical protein